MVTFRSLFSPLFTDALVEFLWPLLCLLHALRLAAHGVTLSWRDLEVEEFRLSLMKIGLALVLRLLMSYNAVRLYGPFG